ncbi:hypothetical protein [Pelistega europaea]|uniref:Uncharacterized protein n=1 Tax=Pelistega europaea TaxID=106147 RepID=A0A7Y4LA53_9BURK|nr:hypothetical protein [Pelistega europaea]NOL49825.1 hypothetical protein [Pelistega europaea]
MFGSSKKQVIFSPSVYGSSYRRGRRMPRWLITFLAGVIIGGGGFWFLQTNYGPQHLSLEEGNRLQTTINNLTQEKNALQQQLDEAKLAINQAKETIKQLQPVVAGDSAAGTSSSGGIATQDSGASASNNAHIQEVIKNLPPDPNNTPVGIRLGNFQGSIGKLNYELIMTKSDATAADIPARVEITTTGVYRNGNRGFEQLAPLAITANEYVRLQGQASLTKSTLTPQKVEVKVVDTQTRKVIGFRSFDVTPVDPSAGTSAN